MNREDYMINVNRNQIHVTTASVGSPTTLILWCGLGSTSLSFAHFLRQSEREHVNIIAIDPPGHGQTPPWRGQFQVSDVLAVWSAAIAEARSQGASDVLIGGHSYGAYTALMALPSLLSDAVEPKVAGVILLDGGYLDPAPDYNRDEVLASAQAFLDSQRFASWADYFESERQRAKSWDEEIEIMLRSNMREHEGHIIPAMDLEGGMQAYDVLAEFHVTTLPPSSIPALLVRANEPIELNEAREAGVVQLQEKLHNLKVVIIDSGHDLVVDNPRDATAAVWDFVHELVAAPTV